MNMNSSSIIGTIVGIAIQAVMIWGAFWILAKTGLIDKGLTLQTAAIVGGVIVATNYLTSTLTRYMVDMSREKVVEAAPEPVNADASSNASSVASGAVTEGGVMV
jgi:hypothetical protein